MIFTSPENGAVVTASGRIDVTGNGGKHWSQAADANHVAAIDFVESSDGWAITWSNYTASGVRFGPLLYTSDGGRTWSKLPVPSEGPLVTVDFTDELVGYGVTSAGVFLFTNDGGRSWSKIRTPVAISDICFMNDLEGWVAGDSNIYHFSAGALTVLLPASRVGLLPKAVPTPTLSCAGETVWADYVFRIGGGNASTVLVRSLDGGRSWRVVHSEFNSVPGPENELAFNAYTNAFGVTDNRHAWFLGSCFSCNNSETSMTWTSDGGAHFSHTFIVSPRGSFLIDYAVATFVDPTRGWALLTRQTKPSEKRTSVLLTTVDGGSQWHVVTTTAPVAGQVNDVGEPTIPTAGVNQNALNPTS